MIVSSPDYQYTTEGKQAYRDFVVRSFVDRSLSVNRDGTLRGKWLEPIGHGAETFRHLLSRVPLVLRESDLIGIDYHPDNPQASIDNVQMCRGLFPQAAFVSEDWVSYCHSTSQQHDSIRYIVYDLYTSTFGLELERNLDAIRALVRHSLCHNDQVLVALTADLQTTARHRHTEQDYRELLHMELGSDRGIAMSDVMSEPMYRYRTTTGGDEMGVVVVEFYRSML